MVSLQYTQGIANAGTVERSHLHAGRTERLPILARRSPTADPIVQDPDLYTLTRLLDQHLTELVPDVVVTQKIVLEVDEPLRRLDGFEPRGERRLTIPGLVT